MLKPILNLLLYFIVAVPCWLILLKDRTNKECINMGILILILEMATKYLLP